jgi:hypothetical protein
MINESPFKPGFQKCQCACAIDLGQLAVIFVMDVTVFLFLCWLFRKEIAWLMERFKKPEKPKKDITVKTDEMEMLDSGFAYGGGINRRRES